MAAMLEERNAEAARASVSRRARRSGSAWADEAQELERDLAPQPRVFGQVDLAHAAGAQALAHAIVLNGGADHFRRS